MSLRARVLLGLTVIAAVLVIAASVIIRSTETYLLEQVDDQLSAINMPMPDGDFSGNLRPPGPPDDEQTWGRRSPLYSGYVASDGSVQTRFEPNIADDVALPEIDGADALESARTGESFTVGSVDATTRYRVRASVDQRTGLVMVSALPLDDTDAAVRRLVAMEIGATVVALGVLALVAWWVIRLGVRPVDDMTEAAEAIAAGDLSHRVPESDPRTEAGKLGLALNQMLGRIEEAFDERARTDERLRRFVADASHELRTPLTTIRGYGELYRTGALAGDDLEDAMRRTEQEAMRMGVLVDDMLQLARLDQGRPLDAAPVDLGSLARDAAADARAVRPGRPITAEVADAARSGSDEPAPVVVLGDSDRLRQVIANLVGNALVHTSDDAAIEIRVTQRGAEAVLDVTDHGSGMAPDVAGRAFERFFRADPSRSRHQGGSGLGLAIVQAVVAAHGGHIELRSQVGTGTTVRVLLPLAGPAPTPPPTTSATGVSSRDGSVPIPGALPLAEIAR